MLLKISWMMRQKIFGDGFLSIFKSDQRTDAQFRLAEIQFFKNNFDSVLAMLAPLTENLKADESNDALILQYFVTENRFQFAEALKQYSHAELLARQFKIGEAIQELSSIIDIYPTAPLADDVLLKKGRIFNSFETICRCAECISKIISGL